MIAVDFMSCKTLTIPAYMAFTYRQICYHLYLDVTLSTDYVASAHFLTAMLTSLS